MYNLSFFPVSQPGEELFPKDEHGELIFDTVDLCAMWEVSTALNSYVSDVGGERLDRGFRKRGPRPIPPPGRLG